MNTKNKRTMYLSIITVMAAGVLSGCQYCEPLLMASLITGIIYRTLSSVRFSRNDEIQAGQ